MENAKEIAALVEKELAGIRDARLVKGDSRVPRDSLPGRKGVGLWGPGPEIYMLDGFRIPAIE
jgi:hypothetical protein